MSTSSVSSTVVSVFENHPVSVIQSQDGSFVLAGKDEFLSRIASARAFVESYVFETEDDRKSARSAKAEMNKLDKQIKAELKNVEAQLFAPVRDDVKEINSAVSELVSVLSEQINFFDNKYKDEKMELIREAFESALQSSPESFRTVVDLAHVLDAKWLNRTTPMSKVVEGLDDRFQAIESVAELADGSVEDAVLTLQSVAWNSTRAVSRIMKQKAEAEAKAQKLAEERALVESAEQSGSEGDKEAVRVANVYVPVSALTKFRRVMNANGWDFEYID